MTIKSSPFGPVTLTGEDAEKFRRQITYGRPKQAAIESLKRGKTLLAAMDKDGRVQVPLKQSDGTAQETPTVASNA